MPKKAVISIIYLALIQLFASISFLLFGDLCLTAPAFSIVISLSDFVVIPIMFPNKNYLVGFANSTNSRSRSIWSRFWAGVWYAFIFFAEAFESPEEGS